DGWNRSRQLGLRRRIFEGAARVRKTARGLSSNPIPIGRDCDANRSRPPYGIQRSASERCETGFPERSSNGEILLISGGRTCDIADCRDLWRIWLHERLSGREIFT